MYMDRKKTIRIMLISLVAACTTALAAGYGYTVISGHVGDGDSQHAEGVGDRKSVV